MPCARFSGFLLKPLVLWLLEEWGTDLSLAPKIHSSWNLSFYLYGGTSAGVYIRFSIEIDKEYVFNISRHG